MSPLRWWLAGVAAVIIALGAGCDGALHRMQDRAEKPAMEAPAGAVTLGADDDRAPPVMTRERLERGEDRYDRVCAACHGLLGDGDSVVARAMVGRKPRSLVDAAAVAFADARIARTIDSGYGAMPALADVLPAADRFAVVQFVRALQRREVVVGDLPAARRAEAERWLK